jgi:hypothetical protein
LWRNLWRTSWSNGGGGAGFVVGCVLSTQKTSKSYKAWLSKHRQDKCFIDFLYFYNQTDYRTQFLCPLTFEPIITPVISPYGRVFEKTAIEKWLRDHPNSDPFIPEPLNIKDLRRDHTTLGKHCKELKNILDGQIKEKGFNDFIKKGIEKLKADLDNQAKVIFQEEMKVLIDKLLEGKITRKEFSGQISHLQAVLDGEAEENLKMKNPKLHYGEIDYN